MDIYLPYTYLIGWSNHDKWYYGVRFAKNCHPNDLWKTYFTSSKYVKQFRIENGEPDIILIRNTFNDSNSARIWEHKVLKRIKAKESDRWINLSDGKAIYNDPHKRIMIGKKISEKLPKVIEEKRECPLYDEWYCDTRQAGIYAAIGLGAKSIKKHREIDLEYDKKYRISRSAGGKSRKGFVWIKNIDQNISTQIPSDEIPRFLSLGWKRGRIL